MGLIYSHSIIEEHTLYRSSPSTLSRVSDKDYPGKNYFSMDIPCIDLDAYEESRSGENDCTVDAVIGVADYLNNRAGAPSLALVELRMKYKSASNLDFTKISRKVQHSRNLLAGGTIHNKDYFIFTADVAAPAVYVFKSHRQTHPNLKNAEPISVEGFKNLIKNIEDYPYQPINSAAQIWASLSVSDFAALVDLLDYWLGQSQTYKIRYDLREARHILEVMNDFLLNFQPMGEFMQEYIELYLEDISNKIRVIS